MKEGLWCFAAQGQHRVRQRTTDGNGLNGAQLGNFLLLHRAFPVLLGHTLNKLG